MDARPKGVVVRVAVRVSGLVQGVGMRPFVHRLASQRGPSIPAAMWWAVTTLTTVGYGDVFPMTTIGKLLGSVIAVLGIGMFALPTGILGAGFVEEMERRKQPRNCPHCGNELPK